MITFFRKIQLYTFLNKIAKMYLLFSSFVFLRELRSINDYKKKNLERLFSFNSYVFSTPN